MTDSADLYPEPVIGFLEMLWGTGWLSPGGPDELARLLEGEDLAGRHVLDIGCGAGGIDCLLVSQYGAARVTGIDVEQPVLDTAARRARDAGVADKVELVLVSPRPLPFADPSFDVVFSKDSIVHIPDKPALAREVYRVLKPGGVFTFTLTIVNLSSEPVTITTLDDTNALSQACLDLIGTSLDANDGAPGGSDEVTCTYDTTTAPVDIWPGWGTLNEMCLMGVYLVAP